MSISSPSPGPIERCSSTAICGANVAMVQRYKGIIINARDLQKRQLLSLSNFTIIIPNVCDASRVEELLLSGLTYTILSGLFLLDRSILPASLRSGNHMLPLSSLPIPVRGI